MRTLRSLFVLSAVFFLAFSSSSFANDLAIDSQIDSETAEVVAATDSGTAEVVAATEGAALDLGPMAEILGTPWADPKPVASFGSHCSGAPSPWTCSYYEGGLGCPPGGGCSYSCQCDECTMSDGRVETVMINCTLVDDGGCLACPM